MSRRQRVLGLIAGAVLVGGVAFSISYYVMHLPSQSAANQLDEPPTFTVDDLSKAVQEESPKTPFRRELAGLTFVDTISAWDLGCPEDTPVKEVPGSTVSSPLIFDTDFLPEGFAFAYGGLAAVCGDRVIAYSIQAIGPKLGAVQKEVLVHRSVGRLVTTDTPEDRISEVTVSGKPAVLIRDLPFPGAPVVTILTGGNLSLTRTLG